MNSYSNNYDSRIGTFYAPATQSLNAKIIKKNKKKKCNCGSKKPPTGKYFLKGNKDLYIY